MEVLGLFAAVLVFAVVIVLSSRAKQRWLESLKILAEDFDLVVSPGGWLTSASAHGGPPGVSLGIDSFTRGTGKSQTTFTRIEATLPLPGGLLIKSEGVASALGKMFKGDDLQTGDRAFDSAVLIRGEERGVRASLDAETRSLILGALSEGIEVEDGAVRWIITGLEKDVDLLREKANAVLELAAALRATGDTDARLAQIARSDASDLVAERALVELVGSNPARHADLLREIADGGRTSLRLTAGRLLGAEDSVRVARAVVEGGQLAPEALEVLASTGTTVPMDRLRHGLDSTDPRTRALVIRCLAHTEGAVEPLLIAGLEDPETEVVIAAADALAQVGTPVAVQPLNAAIKGLFVDGDLKRSANGAIAAIQDRVGHGLGGGLSVAREVAGRLAVSDTVPGSESEPG